MISTIRLPQGIDSGVAWPIVDASGDPAVLTGYTAKCQVRKKALPLGDKLADITAQVSAGHTSITWTAEESLAWTWTEGFADVILVNPEGRPIQVVWQGRLVVDPVVTVATVA